MEKVRHVLGISGGKDSAALAIYLKQRHPELDVEYYFCDTGKELPETYELIEKLETYLGKEIAKLTANHDPEHENPFDYYLQLKGGYLPSNLVRWCTQKLKLEPFERFIGTDPVISYVGIRDDEDREGYISKKPNVQSVFPFRHNIWSSDVIKRVLANPFASQLAQIYHGLHNVKDIGRALEIIATPLSLSYNQDRKLKDLLNLDTQAFNYAVVHAAKAWDMPLSRVESFPLADNEDRLVRADIFALLENSGVGVPEYYQKIEFEVEGQKGEYARSRSGCFFCFFQQKIEWVWLMEQHPDLFAKAMEYEKEGYSWMDDETLESLTRPERIKAIKKFFINRENNTTTQSARLLDILNEEAEGVGCAACFI